MLKRMDDTLSPATETIPASSQVVVPSEGEILSMIAEEVQFGDDPTIHATACRLLAAGYTVRVVARKLGIRPSTLWRWAQDESGVAAIEAGRRIRENVLGQDLEDAAHTAINALVDVASDDSGHARDRVKASEAILDRCGLLSGSGSNENSAVVAVDIDFDERLARIVAGSKER